VTPLMRSVGLACSAVGVIRTIVLELTEPIRWDEFDMAGS
jgi:hypothetical protein